jgi:hypothetical protein
MSATTIIATVETDANSIFTAALARLTAIETAIEAAGGPLATALGDVGKAVSAAVGAGATVAAAATNPATLAVAIGAVAVPVTTAFEDVYEGIKGFVEGVEGINPTTGATTAETDGAAAGEGVKNLFDAIRDTIKGL